MQAIGNDVWAVEISPNHVLVFNRHWNYITLFNNKDGQTLDRIENANDFTIEEFEAICERYRNNLVNNNAAAASTATA